MSSFAIIGDLMLGDQPLCCGFGVRSACRGDYGILLGDFAEYVKPFSFVIGNLESVVFDEVPDGGPDDADEGSAADDTPVVRFINKMLMDAIKGGSSDLHFEPFEKALRLTRKAGVGNITSIGQ